MSPAGTSVSGPMCLNSSFMKLWQNLITSASLLPLGLKSLPPLPPPMGRPVRLFLNTCSKARNFMMERFTDGWKRSPPLYGPSADDCCTLKPRFIWRRPSSSIHGTRKMIALSGSTMRSMTL